MIDIIKANLYVLKATVLPTMELLLSPFYTRARLSTENSPGTTQLALMAGLRFEPSQTKEPLFFSKLAYDYVYSVEWEFYSKFVSIMVFHTQISAFPDVD